MWLVKLTKLKEKLTEMLCSCSMSCSCGYACLFVVVALTWKLGTKPKKTKQNLIIFKLALSVSSILCTLNSNYKYIILMINIVFSDLVFHFIIAKGCIWVDFIRKGNSVVAEDKNVFLPAQIRNTFLKGRNHLLEKSYEPKQRISWCSLITWK